MYPSIGHSFNKVILFYFPNVYEMRISDNELPEIFPFT